MHRPVPTQQRVRAGAARRRRGAGAQEARKRLVQGHPPAIRQDGPLSGFVCRAGHLMPKQHQQELKFEICVKKNS